MNEQERQKLKSLIVATALYYGQELADAVIGLFVEDLCDLPFESVARAIKDLRRNPKTTRFPLPASIRAMIHPGADEESEAREAASRIIAGVAKLGWCNSGSAREYIGDLGWYVVDRQGGWQRVCELMDHRNFTTLQAQWRDLAHSALRRAKLGTLNHAPALPAPHPMESATPSIIPKSGEQQRLEKLQLQIEQLKKQENPDGHPEV